MFLGKLTATCLGLLIQQFVFYLSVIPVNDALLYEWGQYCRQRSTQSLTIIHVTMLRTTPFCFRKLSQLSESHIKGRFYQDISLICYLARYIILHIFRLTAHLYIYYIVDEPKILYYKIVLLTRANLLPCRYQCINFENGI